MTTEQRTCPACRTQFTWTSAAPRQKFCSTRCKHKWWDTHRRRALAALRHDQPGGHDQRGDDPRAAAHPGRGDDHGGYGPPALTASPACPHCRQPVAIVAWLVPSAAATVATPPPAPSPRHADAVRDNP
jgi:endogenous inhibitor of DNA gyrase (YacG/DUF329 family)